MSRGDHNLRRWGLISASAMVVIAVAPPLACIGALGAPWAIVAAGATLWALAVLAKRALAALLKLLGSAALSTRLQAVLAGLLSALVELAAAAVYLVNWPNASLIEVFSFGVGAGSVEAVYVLILGLFYKDREVDIVEWEEGAVASLCVRYMAPIERFFALIGHIGSRGLIYAALQTAGVGKSLIWIFAVALFAGVDGVAAYGVMRRWNWASPPICRRAHLFFACVSTIELAAFLWIFPR